MRGFVDACQKQGVDGARWFVPASRGFIALRNWMFRLMPHLPWRRWIEEMPLKVGNAIDLRDYEGDPRGTEGGLKGSEDRPPQLAAPLP